ncbi:MAG: DUF3500 domain-containing protein [Paludibacter sp.]
MKTAQPLLNKQYEDAVARMQHPRDFRPFMPPANSPEPNTTRRERTLQNMTNLPQIRECYEEWTRLWQEPFRGITTDGTVQAIHRPLQPNGAPTAAMVAAANEVIRTLSPGFLSRVRFAVDGPEWRRWHNMPLCWERDGISIEDMNDRERAAVLALVKASVSSEGYAHIQDLMFINRYSGDLVGRPRYLNEWCYQFGLFGTPSMHEPWGWQLYGHHLVINALVMGETLVMSPTFLGAEPTYVDDGPHQGMNVFSEHEDQGLLLMRNLSPALRGRAQIHASSKFADLPPGRRHWADGTHLGGAFQDNRIIPYEGIAGREMTPEDRQRLYALIREYFILLPEPARALRLAEIEAHLDDTWFSWIGGYDDWSPFYYRIQSPVVLLEFDHQAGVFLKNPEPQRFHVHTIARTPNGGDYGHDLLPQYRQQLANK